MSSKDRVDVESQLRSYATKIADLETIIVDLKQELKEKNHILKETRAILGEHVVAASKSAYIEPKVAPSQPVLAESSRKRGRSPSIEILEKHELSRKKGKAKEISTARMTRMTPPDSTPTRVVSLKSQTSQSSSASSEAVKLSPSEKKHSVKFGPQSEKTLEYIHLANTSMSMQSSDLECNGQGSTTTDNFTVTPSVLSISFSEEAAGEDELDPNDFHNPSESLPQTYKARSPTAQKERKLERKSDVKQEDRVKDVFNLPSSTVKHYLGSAKPLTISPPPLDLEVPRAFLRITYGGSDQYFLQFIREDKNPSGRFQRRIVFPMLEMNPAMPSVPGEPGLIFASRHEILSDPPWSLFCKRSNAAPAVWLYLGDYESVLCGTMTAAQFKAQTSVTKQRWAELILKAKILDVYVAMRARIALRKDRLLPASDKEAERALVKSEVAAIKNGKGRAISEKEIIAAFSKGDEGIDIIRMTCVKYDHVFASDMKNEYSEYAPVARTGKGKEKSGPRKSKPSKGVNIVQRLSNAKIKDTDGEEEGGTDDGLNHGASPKSNSRTDRSSFASNSRPRRAAAARRPTYSYPIISDDDDSFDSPSGSDLTDSILELKEFLKQLDGK